MDLCLNNLWACLWEGMIFFFNWESYMHRAKKKITKENAAKNHPTTLIFSSQRQLLSPISWVFFKKSFIHKSIYLVFVYVLFKIAHEWYQVMPTSLFFPLIHLGKACIYSNVQGTWLRRDWGWTSINYAPWWEAGLPGRGFLFLIHTKVPSGALEFVHISIYRYASLCFTIAEYGVVSDEQYFI